VFSPTPIVGTGTVIIAVQHIRTGLQLHQLPHPTDPPDTVIAVDRPFANPDPLPISSASVGGVVRSEEGYSRLSP